MKTQVDHILSPVAWTIRDLNHPKYKDAHYDPELESCDFTPEEEIERVKKLVIKENKDNRKIHLKIRDMEFYLTRIDGKKIFWRTIINKKTFEYILGFHLGRDQMSNTGMNVYYITFYPEGLLQIEYKVLEEWLDEPHPFHMWNIGTELLTIL